MENQTQKEVITSLQVSNLFGRFNHNVIFSSDSNISIISAPNGHGKTVLLRIINSIFNGNLHFFWKINFEQIKVEFKSKKSISIIKRKKKELNDDEITEDIVIFRCTGFGSEDDEYTPPLDISSAALREFENYFPVERLNRDTWLDFSSERILSTDEILKNYSGQLPPRLRNPLKIPEWLQVAIRSVNAHLVETQRLLYLDEPQDRRPLRRRQMTPSSVVDKDASDLSRRIGSLLQDYASASQNLDQTFPKRILASSVSKVGNEREIQNNLQELAKKCDELRSVGLLRSTMIDPIMPSEIPKQENIRRILEIYIDDTRKKLNILDETYKKISLFKQILNERFSFKTIEIDADHGIRAIDDFGNHSIPLAELSSGEQHELVLVYELLFKVEDGTIILIDEPELSFHVTWQRKFIEDLQKIQTLKELQVVIATHSPQIINDKWDLVQELST